MKIIYLLAIVFALSACKNSGSENKKEETMKQEEAPKTFQSITPKEITDNMVKLIGDQWMLVTAGDSARFNTMTASWGGIGYLWNKPVVFIFIRPQRYTFGFIEEQEHFTLSFFTEQYREALKLCGTTSGRDGNKVEKAGLTPRITSAGNVAFEEARLILECRKLYADFMNPAAFIDPTIVEGTYPGKDFHKVYVAEIVNVWEKK